MSSKFTQTTYSPTSIRPTIAEFEESAYIANDRDKLKVVYGYNIYRAYDAGIADPDTFSVVIAGGGSSAILGVYYLRYRYKNSHTGYVSNASSEEKLEVTGAGNKLQWKVTLSSDTKVDGILLEVLIPGSTTWRLVDEVANATDSTTLKYEPTSTFSIPITEYLTEDTPNSTFHYEPPVFQNVVSHRGRLFGCGAVVESGGTAAVGGDVMVSGFGTEWTSTYAQSGRLLMFPTINARNFIKSVDSPTDITLEDAAAITTSGNYTISSINPNVLYWSNALLPESWDTINNFTNVLLKTDDSPVGMESYYDNLLIFGSHSTETLLYTEDPTTEGKVSSVSDKRGAVNQECVVRVDNIIYTLDRHGIWMFRGGQAEHISYAIDEILDGVADGWDGVYWTGAANSFHGQYYPNRREVIWWLDLRRTGESTAGNYRSIHYHIDNHTFTLGHYGLDIKSSMSAPDQNLVLRPVIANANGDWFYYGVGTSEGAHPDSATSGYVSSTGPATTHFNFASGDGSLYTSRETLAGVPFVIDGFASGIIQTVAGTLITPVDTLPSPPTPGDVVFIGPIETSVTTPEISINGPEKDNQFIWFEIIHTPNTVGSIRVQFFGNYSAAPVEITTDSATFNANNYNLSIDSADLSTVICKIDSTTKGYIRIPIMTNYYNVMSAKITAIDPGANFRINAFRFVGSSSEVKVA